LDANIKISYGSNHNGSDKTPKKSLKNINYITNLSFHERELHLLNKQDRSFVNKVNLLYLKKYRFKHNITDLITELIRFKIWKLNHLKIKPMLLNKGDNLNYIQKSEKNIKLDKKFNLTLSHENENVTVKDNNITKFPNKHDTRIIPSKKCQF